jgi:hypothetical protein
VKFSGTIILLGFVLCSCASRRAGPVWIEQAQQQKHPWGYYSGQVEARWENDGRTMTLLSELRYTDPDGEVWIAPAGSNVDGASIPRALWSLMGGPFEGKYRNASVLHDVSYDQHARSWERCDRMFYNAMRCSGVSAIEAKTMFYALYRFGRHGAFAIKKAKRVKPSELAQAQGEEETEQLPRAIPVNTADINTTRDWIRSANPSMEQIEQRANAEPR